MNHIFYLHAAGSLMYGNVKDKGEMPCLHG